MGDVVPGRTVAHTDRVVLGKQPLGRSSAKHKSRQPDANGYRVPSHVVRRQRPVPDQEQDEEGALEHVLEAGVPAPLVQLVHDVPIQEWSHGNKLVSVPEVQTKPFVNYTVNRETSRFYIF